MAVNYYGLDVSKVKNPTGQWFQQYINPSTSASQRQNLYNTYGTRYGWMNPAAVSSAQQSATSAPAPAATTPAAATPAPTFAADTQAATTPTTPDMSAYMPAQAAGVSINPNLSYQSIQSFVPQDVTASPLYQWQKKVGQNALAQYMSANGLNNSSADIKANSDFLNQLGAQEAQRQTDIATQNATNANNFNAQLYGTNAGLLETEANRRNDMAQAENARLSNVDTNNWNKLMQVMQMAYGYSPTAAIDSALSGTSSLYNAMANLTGNAYGQMGTIPATSSASSSSVTPFNPFPYINTANPANNYYDVISSLLGQ